MKSDLSFREQTVFFAPLAATSVLVFITHSLINAGMARMPGPETIIAAYAVAKSTMHIFQSPTMMIRQAVTALVDERKNLRKPLVFLSLVVLGVVFILATIAFSGLSRVLFRDVMGITGKTLEEAVVILRVLILFPAMVSIRDCFQGFAIKFRTARLITLASVARVLYVFLFVTQIERLTAVRPAILAGLMFLGAVVVEAVIMTFGTLALNRNIPRALDEMEKPETGMKVKSLTYPDVARFYVPLMATTLIRMFVMPSVNSGLARTDSPDMALSVFAVAWSLGMIILSPSNMFHQVSLNYCDEPGRRYNRGVRRFAMAAAAIMAVLMGILAFTPIGYWVLTRLIGAGEEISVLSADVLKVMCVLPFLMVAREYFWGLLMKRRLTGRIWKGKAVSLVAVVAVLVVVTRIGLPNPAMAGAIAYACAEAAELLFLYVSLRNGSGRAVMSGH